MFRKQNYLSVLCTWGLNAMYYRADSVIKPDQTISIFGLVTLDTDNNIYIIDQPFAIIKPSGDLCDDIKQIDLGYTKQISGLFWRSARFILCLGCILYSGY